MYKIIVKVSSYCCCYPNNNDFTHLSLEIEDLESESKKVCSVSFTPDQSYAGFYGQINSNSPIISTVVLYSNIDIDLDDFKKELNRNYNNIDGPCDEGVDICSLTSFQFCCHNCSDAGLFTLKYFFPVTDNKIVEAKWQTYKIVTFPLCLATLGCFPFFGSPPLTNGPADIIIKAQLLYSTYGDMNKIPLFPKTKEKQKTESRTLGAKTLAPETQRMS